MIERLRKNWLAAWLLSGVLVALNATAQEEPQEPTESADRSKAQLTLDDLRTFTDVFNQLRRNYVETVDDRTLLHAAIRGMLAELDPHSAYLDQPEYEALDDAAQGRYSGIGINVQQEDSRIVVLAIINGSPADLAGINPGDVITSIDGRAVKGRSLPDAMDELDGDPGTQVSLGILTPEGAEREVELEREYLRIPTLSYELLDRGYGYFRLTQFHRDSASDLEQTLQSIAGEGTALQGVILDLRDNPGGLLQPAVDIADGFLDEGLIVATRGRNSAMELEFKARPGQWLPDIPVVVLVDRGSASASEVLAGALQDHGRAIVIGEQTFGKGSVQTVLPLRNGAGIKLTTARYYTPLGRSIQAEGIRPDIEIGDVFGEQGPDDRPRESDLDRHLGKHSDISIGRSDAGPGNRTGIEGYPVDEILEVLDSAGLITPGDAEEETE